MAKAYVSFLAVYTGVAAKPPLQRLDRTYCLVVKYCRLYFTVMAIKPLSGVVLSEVRIRLRSDLRISRSRFRYVDDAGGIYKLPNPSCYNFSYERVKAVVRRNAWMLVDPFINECGVIVMPARIRPVDPVAVRHISRWWKS